MDKIRLSLFLCTLGVVSATQVACSSSLNEQLFEAVKEGNCAEVEQLLKAGASVQAINSAGDTALRLAVMWGRESIVDKLLRAGADIRATGVHDSTLLHLTIDEQIVKLLLREGADVNAADVDGVTALHLAASRGCERMVDQLLRADANVHAENKRGGTALHLAILRERESVIDRLLKAGADVNAVDMYGNTALHLARNSAIVQRLVQASADFEVLDGQKKSPLVRRANPSPWEEEWNVVKWMGYLISVGAGIDDLLHSDYLRKYLRPHVDLIKSRAAFLRDLLKGQDLLKDQGLYSVLEDLIGQYAGFPISEKAVGKMEAILLRDLIENVWIAGCLRRS